MNEWTIKCRRKLTKAMPLFPRLFEMEKDLKKLFRRLMSVRESGDYVFDSVRLERHATLVMKHLGQAVDNLDDSTYFSELLIMLGEKHSAYDVKPEMLPVLTRPQIALIRGGGGGKYLYREGATNIFYRGGRQIFFFFFFFFGGGGGGGGGSVDHSV